MFILPVMGGAILHAQPDAPQARKDYAPRKGICEKLDLSDVQKKQLGDMRMSMRRNAVQLRGKIALARIDLQDLLSADEPDRKSIEKKLTEIAELQTQQKLLRIDHMVDVKKMLTPEQRKKWKDSPHGMRIDGQRMRGHRRGLMMDHRRFMDGCDGMMGNGPGRAETPIPPVGNEDGLSPGAFGCIGENPTLEDFPDEIGTDW